MGNSSVCACGQKEKTYNQRSTNYLSSEVRLMMNTTRSILGRVSSFSMGRGRYLASLLMETNIRIKSAVMLCLSKRPVMLQMVNGSGSVIGINLGASVYILI